MLYLLPEIPAPAAAVGRDALFPLCALAVAFTTGVLANALAEVSRSRRTSPPNRVVIDGVEIVADPRTASARFLRRLGGEAATAKFLGLAFVCAALAASVALLAATVPNRLAAAAGTLAVALCGWSVARDHVAWRRAVLEPERRAHHGGRAP